MKKLLKHKKMIIMLIVILIIVLLFIFLKVLSNNKNVYGDRCSDSANYKLSDDTINKAKEEIEKIGNVKDIDIHTKLCTVKIIITLEDDVELEKVKSMSSELLSTFSEKELKYYDFSLFVESENEDSEIYPINVTRHNSEDSFAW